MLHRPEFNRQPSSKIYARRARFAWLNISGRIKEAIQGSGFGAEAKQSETVTNRGIQMTDKILDKMKKRVYYPGNHLGKRDELSILEKEGYLQRMDGSFLCGPDSEPNYCITEKGLQNKGKKK